MNGSTSISILFFVDIEIRNLSVLRHRYEDHCLIVFSFVRGHNSRDMHNAKRKPCDSLSSFPVTHFFAEKNDNNQIR